MPTFDETFPETQPGQIVIGAYRYLEAARILRSSDEWENAPGLLKTPVLHLLSHGIELLLKYPMFLAGVDPKVIRKEYGHDLHKLWLIGINVPLRDQLFQAATECWRVAAESERWPDSDFNDDPHRLLTEHVARLAYLHGQKSNFALRYTISKPERAPHPQFLIEVFGGVADRIAKNPASLPLS